jgi:hypothetical protein
MCREDMVCCSRKNSPNHKPHLISLTYKYHCRLNFSSQDKVTVSHGKQNNFWSLDLVCIAIKNHRACVTKRPVCLLCLSLSLSCLWAFCFVDSSTCSLPKPSSVNKSALMTYLAVLDYCIHSESDFGYYVACGKLSLRTLELWSFGSHLPGVVHWNLTLAY